MKRTFFLFVVCVLIGLGIVSSACAYEGYEAGRQWGRENGITDTDYNSTDTSAFAEGVRQSAREQRQQLEQDE